MNVSWSHVFQQGACIRTLGGVAVGGLLPKGKGDVQTPGPKFESTLAPRSEKLLTAYTEWCGGRDGAYSNVVPPHLFPQWGFPPMAKALGRLPWPMTKVLNQGCRLEVVQPLPADQPLKVSTWLAEVREDAHKVRLTTRIVTGTEDTPECLIADVYAVVPTGKKPKGEGKKAPPVVPDGSKTLLDRTLGKRAGLEFALLTGDFNPIHWVGPYAKMAGFRSTILHGFGSMAIAWEAIVNETLDGDAHRLKWMDLRFVRPQFLPGACSVCIDESGGFAVGKGPGERATALGTYGVEENNG